MSDEDFLEKTEKHASAWVALLDKLANVVPWVNNWLHRPIIVPQHADRFWHLGKVRDLPAMQLHSKWYVTNRTANNMHILNAEVVRPHTPGTVSVRHFEGAVYGHFPLIPQVTTEMTADFWIQPPIAREGRDIELDIVFTDSNGQKITCRRVKFPSTKKQGRQRKSLQSENVGDLSDQAERAIAAALKEEATRYKQNGRSGGGLGSIVLVGNGMTNRAHLYQDGWRNADGSRQSISPGNDGRVLASDVGDNLVKYYRSLDADKQVGFRAALLSRLDRRIEYYGVSYLIVYVALRGGFLIEALDQVNTRLPPRWTIRGWLGRRIIRDEELPQDQRYGYSDVFAFLNALLKLNHADLANNELDAIERVAVEAETHSFGVIDKVNAVRNFRLGQQYATSIDSGLKVSREQP